MDEPISVLWIDESGDCGFKFEYGSTRFLVIVAVYLHGSHEGEILRALNSLRSRFNFNAEWELKFSRCPNIVKKECLTIIAQLPLQYKAIVVDKRNLKAPALQHHPHQLYAEMIRRLLYDNAPPLQEATLVLDESVAKIHHKEFSGMLKKYLSKNTVRNIKQVRSKGNMMVQVADMIAGSIFRAYEKGDEQWYNMIKSKEKILIVF